MSSLEVMAALEHQPFATAIAEATSIASRDAIRQAGLGSLAHMMDSWTRRTNGPCAKPQSVPAITLSRPLRDDRGAIALKGRFAPAVVPDQRRRFLPGPVCPSSDARTGKLGLGPGNDEPGPIVRMSIGLPAVSGQRTHGPLRLLQRRRYVSGVNSQLLIHRAHELRRTGILYAP